MTEAELPVLPDLTWGRDVREGGQAIVGRAHHTGTDAEVAVKVSRHEPAAKAALQREIDALVSIHEQDGQAADWLVSVVGHGTTEDGRPYLILPWIPHSLLSWWTATDPSLGERFDALVQAAAAVARFHAVGSLHEITVHRDLKPANFLVETEPRLRVRLADLGTVKARTYRERTHNTVMFTPTYAPLEQRLPIDRPLEPSIDVHALGVMVFQGITGSLPQTAQTRVGYRLPLGDELLALESSRDALGPDKLARFEALRHQPLASFYDLEAAPDLLPEDRELLDQSLVKGLGSEAGDTVLQAVLPAIERALCADPDRRAGSARELLAACVVGREQAGLAPSTALSRLVDSALSLPDPVVRARPAPRRRVLPLVVGSMVLGALVAGGLAYALWPRTEALSAAEAEALGVVAELAPPRVSVRYVDSADVQVILGGVKSTGSVLPPRPLTAGSHRLLVLSAGGDTVVDTEMSVSERGGAWRVSVGADADRTALWTVAPDELVRLTLDRSGRVQRRGG